MGIPSQKPYTPNSGAPLRIYRSRTLFSKSFLIKTNIKSDRNRNRMLLQAVSLSRLGNALKQEQRSKRVRSVCRFGDIHPARPHPPRLTQRSARKEVHRQK